MQVAANIPILRFADGVTREHATYNGENIKQADVNLLSYPLHEITDPLQIKRDLAYYIPRVGDGPAMTQAVFSILYSRLGMPARAYELFLAGYRPNKRPPSAYWPRRPAGTIPILPPGRGSSSSHVERFWRFGDHGGRDRPVKDGSAPGWHSLTLTGIGPDKKTYSVGLPK